MTPRGTLENDHEQAPSRFAARLPDVIGLAGIGCVVAGVWLVAGAGWALITAGVPIGGFYIAGQIRLLLTPRE